MFDYTKDTGQQDSTYRRLTPHPDGKAWPKCCRHNEDGLCCAFIKTQESGARLDHESGERRCAYGSELIRRTVKNTPFMCAHRSTDDGYYRVCAGWDACFGNKSQGAKS